MKKLYLILPLMLLLCLLSSAAFAGTDYADPDNWAFLDTSKDGAADVFMVAPTVYRGEENVYSWNDMTDERRPKFIGALMMQIGIYDQNTCFFAPFYHQAALNTANFDEETRAPYYDRAYQDIRDAFQYYLDHLDTGRPIILSGFSQGAEMCIRLLKEFFADESLNSRLVACYAYGWRITQEELDQNPHIHFAQGESDTGVLIVFNSEAEFIESSPIVPAGTRSMCINPLTWSTDSEYADKSLNLGSCLTDYSGAVTEETPALCGAYIDETRGTLKLPDIDPEVYTGKGLFDNGIYHFYDYQFFYRNLQKNVQTRLNAFLNK